MSRRKSRPLPAPSNPFENRGNKGRATRLQVRTSLPTDSAFWPRVLDRKARSGRGRVSANKKRVGRTNTFCVLGWEKLNLYSKTELQRKLTLMFLGGTTIFTEMIVFSCWRWKFSPARMIAVKWLLAPLKKTSRKNDCSEWLLGWLGLLFWRQNDRSFLRDGTVPRMHSPTNGPLSKALRLFLEQIGFA